MDESMFITAITDTVNTIYTGLSHEVHKGNNTAPVRKAWPPVASETQDTASSFLEQKNFTSATRGTTSFLDLSTKNIIYSITTTI